MLVGDRLTRFALTAIDRQVDLYTDTSLLGKHAAERAVWAPRYLLQCCLVCAPAGQQSPLAYSRCSKTLETVSHIL